LRQLTYKVAAVVTARLNAVPEQRDRGSVSLETVIWTLFWLGVATAAGIVIAVAVTSRTASIK
jgi:hypothetical protein